MFTIILATILLGLILAPLGCLVLWKRYAYYGDGLAHASMLAVAIGAAANINIIFATIINTILFMYLVNHSQKKDSLDHNARVGFISSIMLSLSLVLSAMYPGSFNLDHLLFGDLLLVTIEDIYVLSIILLFVALFFFLNYKKLILIILSRDIAFSKGINVAKFELLFLSILSFSVVFTIKIVGALLVVSILLIPAMAARLISSDTLSMLCFSLIIIQIMNSIAIYSSLYFDLPFAPSIILSGGSIYLLLALIRFKKSY